MLQVSIAHGDICSDKNWKLSDLFSSASTVHANQDSVKVTNKDLL